MSLQLFESMRVVSLPMRTNFRGVNHREVALFKGEYGWGEFSPFLEYEFQECVPWLLSAIEAATKPRPHLYRGSVKINGTIPAINDSTQIEGIVNRFPGVETFKIKVGQSLQEDISRISQVKRVRPHAKIRLDVNGGWSLKEALTNLEAIYNSVGEIEYVEQPCESIEELRSLKESMKINTPIAGDEVLRKASNPFEIDLQGVVDYLILKVQPLGGVTRAHALASHHKLPIAVSSALESAIGINYGLILAASFKEISFDCGLGTGSLLSEDVAHLPIVDGTIEISDVEPKFEGLEVAPERYEWWKNRVMKTWELIS